MTREPVREVIPCDGCDRADAQHLIVDGGVTITVRCNNCFAKLEARLAPVSRMIAHGTPVHVALRWAAAQHG